MREVYRARNGRLKRDVAIKVLPPSYLADQDRLRRFEQEAEAAAGSLNRPIAALLVVTALAVGGLAPQALFQPAAGPLRFARLTSLDPAVPMFA
jgi:serine/threonine protein kinase